MASNTFAGRTFSAELIEQLVEYYALVLKWNRALNLTTITNPEEFNQRHLCESFLVVRYLSPLIREVWDLGSGLGVPGIPLAICEPALQLKLVEANHKKAIFLEEVSARLNLRNVTVENCRFEGLTAPTAEVALVARAVDKMETLLPQMLRFGESAGQIIILGADALAKTVQREVADKFELRVVAIPDSQNRVLIGINSFT